MAQSEREDWEQYADQSDDEAVGLAGIPFIGGGMAAGKTAKANALRGKIAADIINEVELPEYSKDLYGQYSVAGQYNPQEAAYQTVSEDPRLRDMQMAALERLSGNLGFASQAKANAARYGALDEANQLAKSREDAIRMQAQRSGQMGSGIDSLMQAQSAQMGANRARQGTMDAVHQQALERLANEQAVLGASGGIRNQDFQNNKSNADIINQFGMFNTNAANEAARMNLQNAQNIANMNVGQGNANLDRSDRNTQNLFNARMGKATGQGNAIQGQINSANTAQGNMQAGNDKTTDALLRIASGLGATFLGGSKK